MMVGAMITTTCKWLRKPRKEMPDNHPRIQPQWPFAEECRQFDPGSQRYSSVTAEANAMTVINNNLGLSAIGFENPSSCPEPLSTSQNPQLPQAVLAGTHRSEDVNNRVGSLRSDGSAPDPEPSPSTSKWDTHAIDTERMASPLSDRISGNNSLSQTAETHEQDPAHAARNKLFKTRWAKIKKSWESPDIEANKTSLTKASTSLSITSPANAYVKTSPMFDYDTTEFAITI
jgi:hypothetical protein